MWMQPEGLPGSPIRTRRHRFAVLSRTFSLFFFELVSPGGSVQKLRAHVLSHRRIQSNAHRISHGSVRKSKSGSSTPTSTAPSESSAPPARPAYVAAHKFSGRSTSVSSSPTAAQRNFTTALSNQGSDELVKVVVRDFPGWTHDQLISIRGVPPLARCSSCACVAGMLMRSPCGCSYCEVCMRHLDSTSKCRPHGVKVTRAELVEDPYVYTFCMDLKAMCIWNSDGCNFEGPLGTIQDHSSRCIFREENCGDCDKRLSYRAMASHRSTTCAQRKVACEVCGTQVLASALERHISVCPEVEVLCMICGRRDIKRGQSETHRVECTSLERPCRMHVVGCKHKATNAQLRDHEKMDSHMELFSKFTQSQAERIRALEETLKQSAHASSENSELAKTVEVLRTQVLQLSNRLVLIKTALVEDPFFWNLCPYKAILEVESDGAQVLYSDSFYTPSIPGYKMRLRLLVDHRARLLHMTPQLLPGQFNNIIPWPFPAQYLLRLVDQSGQNQHKDLTVTLGATANLDKPTESGRVLRSPNLQVKFETLEPTQSGVPQFSKNDCIVFMFKINIPSDFMERL